MLWYILGDKINILITSALFYRPNKVTIYEVKKKKGERAEK